MKSILAKIIDWNKERQLLKGEFNHQREITSIIEEIFESTGHYDSLSARKKGGELAKEIVSGSVATEEQIVDAFADMIVYSVGAIGKLGYDPDKVMDEVYKEIASRTGKIIDEKFVKDVDATVYKADLSKCKNK